MNHKPQHQTQKQITVAVLALLMFAMNSMSFTWVGTDANYPNLLTSTNNWSPITPARPSAALGDVLTWDATVAGNLILTNGAVTTNFPGAIIVADSSPGLILNVTAGHTGSLTLVQSNGFTGRIRLSTNMLTVASGAGPVTFGQDTSASDLIVALGNFGASPYPHFITNNSTANTVTFARNISWICGNGNTHTLIFAGPGNFQVNTKIHAGNSGAFVGMQVNGPGTVGLVGNAPVTALSGSAGSVAVNGGTLRFDAASALESAATLILNGGSIDSSVVNLALSPGGNAQTWGGNFTFVGTQNLDIGAGVVTVAAPRVVTVTANTLQVDGTLTGAGGPIKDGAGILYLPSTLQSYTGGTVVSNGILRMDGFPTGTSAAETLRLSGGTFDVDGNSFIISSLIGTNGTSGAIDTIVGGSPILTVGDFNANGNYSGSIQNTAGSLSLIKTGSGTLTLGGASTYSGGTTVSGGTLLVTNASGSATGSGAVTNASAAVFGSGGGGAVTGPVTWLSGSIGAFVVTNISGTPLAVSGSVTLNNNSVLINIPGANPLGAGTYTLMTYNNTGSSGSFKTSAPTFTGAGVSAGSSVSVTTGSGLVQLVVAAPPGLAGIWTNIGNGNWSVAANWSSNPQIPQHAGDVATLGLGSAFTTINLNISTVTNGFISFNNTNSFTVTNNANTLTLDNTNGRAALIVVSGSSNSIATPVSLNDSVDVSTFPGASLAITNVISGTSSSRTLAISSGSGTLILSGNNTYGPSAGSIGTTIQGAGTSTLQLGNNNALGAGDVSVTRNVTILAGAALTVPNNIIMSNAPNSTINNNGNAVTLSGVISGAGALVKDGVGTLTLSGANTYSNDTSINVGTIKLGNVTGVPGGVGFGNVNMSTNTLLDLNGFSPILNGLSSTITNSVATVDSTAVGTMTLTLGESGSFGTFYGNIKSTSGTLALVKDGAGNQTLAGTNTYTGGTTINAGLLRVGNGNVNAAAGLGTGAIADAGTLEYNVIGTITFTNALSGIGALNLANTNLVFNLYGQNSSGFTGNINVNLGSLRITNAAALGTGPKTVTATGGANSSFTEIRLDGSLANINLDSSISFVLSTMSGIGPNGVVGALYSVAGSNTISGNMQFPNGGGNPYIVVSNGSFLTLAGSNSTVAGNNDRELNLGGAGNGLLSGVVSDNQTIPLPHASLRKNDAGTWTITSTNFATGPATVAGGTLVLNGQWAGGAVTIATNGTLIGTGFSSNLTVSLGGKFVPGNYGSIGTFTVSNTLSLQGATYVSLNKSLAQSNTTVNVLVVGTTNVTANTGSSLVVSNLGPALVAGDAFFVFNRAVTNGNLVSITSGFTLASGLVLSNFLAVDGSVKVVQTINPNPGTIQVSVSGSTFTLSWPTNLGWTLQSQTNALSVGLQTNSSSWFDVPNSSLVTTTNITINRTNPAVFYRLRL